MRVLFVTPMFPSSHNIQQGIFVWELAQEFQRQGIDIRVVSVELLLPWFLRRLKRYQKSTAKGAIPEFYPVIQIAGRQWPFNAGMGIQCYYWAKKIRKKVEIKWGNWRPDIIHSHTVFPGALIADVLSEWWGKVQISTSHGADTRVGLNRRASRKHMLKLFQKGLHVACVGDKIVRSFECVGVSSDQLRCIYNGLDMEKLTRASDSLKARFAGQKIIFGLGNLVKTKGFDFLLNAFAQLRNEFPDWCLVIGGGGEEERALNKQATQLRLEGRIFFTGPLSRYNAMEWMDLCDLFCLPSWAEGFGIVYLEAMANGKPVIGVEGEGIAPIIQEYATGLLAPPQNADALAKLLRKLMGNKTMRWEMGMRGRELVHAHFTWAHCARTYLDLYREVLNVSR